jgi:hypothetical protein
VADAPAHVKRKYLISLHNMHNMHDLHDRQRAGANLTAMAPRARPQLVKLSPEVEADVRAGAEQVERGDVADMTPEETRRYVETGELPEHVKTWLASYDSRHAT